MSRVVTLTGPCKRDLHEVHGYLTREAGRHVSDKIISAIYEQFGHLATDPSIGHRRDDLTPNDLWFSKIYSYLVVYSYTPTHVQILAILHMARDAEEILKDRT